VDRRETDTLAGGLPYEHQHAGETEICHIISCHIISCHVISCHITSCHIISCHITSHHIMSHYITSYHVTSCLCWAVTRFSIDPTRSLEGLSAHLTAVLSAAPVLSWGDSGYLLHCCSSITLSLSLNTQCATSTNACALFGSRESFALRYSVLCLSSPLPHRSNLPPSVLLLSLSSLSVLYIPVCPYSPQSTSPLPLLLRYSHPYSYAYSHPYSYAYSHPYSYSCSYPYSYSYPYTYFYPLQMQYWASDVAGLADTLPPLFEFIKRIAHTGHTTAKSMYGVKKGMLQVPPASSICGVTGITSANVGTWVQSRM
jgi:hypothetical protein